MADDLRRRRLAQRARRFERHHLPVGGARVQLAQVRRAGAEALVGLHVDAVGAVVEVEIVDVRRAEEHLQRVGDLAQRQAQAARLVAIDFDDELRVVGAEAG